MSVFKTAEHAARLFGLEPRRGLHNLMQLRSLRAAAARVPQAEPAECR